MLVPLAVAADLVVLVIFVALGRRTHGQDPGAAGFARVIWPFLVGLALAWPATRLRAAPLAPRRALAAATVTVAVGVALRVGVQGRDFAPTFVLVALTFVGAGLAAWRVVAGRVARVETSRRAENE
jgi:hypothetical protein